MNRSGSSRHLRANGCAQHRGCPPLVVDKYGRVEAVVDSANAEISNELARKICRDLRGDSDRLEPCPE